MSGICAGISVPTLVAKYDSVFQGSKYPLNPKPSIRKSSSMPLTHVSSRGFR